MQVGINFLPDVTWAQMSGQQYLNEALELTAQADALGFNHVKITEHYLGAYGGYSPSPITFLSAASQRSRNLRLLTGCVLPVFRHPIQLAAELAMLDCISNGRLEVGFARAWLPSEFDAFGVNMDGSRAVFSENIEAIIKLWTEKKVSWSGAAHKFENVSVYTRPVQNPHPPVWIATTMTPQSFSWAGAAGYRLMVTLLNWDMLKRNLQLYRKAHEEAGHGEVNPENILIGAPVYVAETTEQALAEAEEPFFNSHKVLVEATGEWKQTSSKDYQLYHAALPMLQYKYAQRSSLAEPIAEGKLLAGTPDEVYEQLRQIESRLGVGNFSLFFTFGNLPYAKASRSMELFAKHVLPRLQQNSPQTQTGQVAALV